MGRIEVNLADVHEPQPVPAGQRYNLTVAEAEFRADKNDIRVSIGIDEHLDAPNVTHFVSLPKPEDDERKAGYKRIFLARFLAAFSIPHDTDGFDVEDFAGAQAELELGLSEPNDNGDVYNRLVLPRIQAGEAAAEQGEEEVAPPVTRRAAPAAAAKPATRAATSKPAPGRRR